MTLQCLPPSKVRHRVICSLSLSLLPSTSPSDPPRNATCDVPPAVLPMSGCTAFQVAPPSRVSISELRPPTTKALSLESRSIDPRYPSSSSGRDVPVPPAFSFHDLPPFDDSSTVFSCMPALGWDAHTVMSVP